MSNEEESDKSQRLRFGQLHRRYRRASVSGFVGDLADGKNLVAGVVEDISTGGFRLSNVPVHFAATELVYTVVISGGGNHYRMLAKPCWRKNSYASSYVEMGFKILDAPLEWLTFTMQEIPEFDYEQELEQQP